MISPSLYRRRPHDDSERSAAMLGEKGYIDPVCERNAFLTVGNQGYSREGGEGEHEQTASSG